MNDTTSGDDPSQENVLRPFEPSEVEPLPPVEPSKIVPEPPTAAEEPPPPPTAADAWSPEASAADTDPDDETDEMLETADDSATEEIDGPSASADDDESAQDDADDDPSHYAAAAVAGSLPNAAPEADTITLPRTPFLVGLGVLIAALALFALLWQNAGGDDGGTETVEPSVPDVEEAADETPTDDVDEVGDSAALTAAEAELAASEQTVADLQNEVAALQDRPVPALEGDLMRRIVVGADAKFVDARDDSVAVVGAFGGVSLIDPATNRVVANGNVADRATRVLRTESSVWLTNYADNQVLQVNPSTNTVATSFAFIGPDDLEKDGDTLVIASFDGRTVARVQPDNGDILQSVEVGGRPTAVLSAGPLGMWAAVFDTGEIVQIDRGDFTVVNRVIVGQGPVGLSADDTYLWVANHDEGTIAKVEPKEKEVLWTTSVGNGPTELVSVNGSVWVTVTDDGALVEVDAETGEVLTRTPLGGAVQGGGPTGISYAGGSLWVAMQGEQSVVRVEVG